jgi:predicted AAA+ superfamily ATPase
MEVPRLIQQQIEKQLGKQKVILLYGARRTGKTTMIDHIAEKHAEETIIFLGEDMQVAALLGLRTVANYKDLTHGKKFVIVDEAQAIPEIGKILKLMIDSVKGITIIATGSSSFDLAHQTGEPLVGRNLIYHLYPLAQVELTGIENRLETAQNLERRLIYGGYPELWQLEEKTEKESYLRQMINSYLLKDILVMERIKGADLLYKLLQMLAFQVGSEVSTVELGNNLHLNKATVERYLDLLEKVFIIFPLSGYSNNLRKEITKSKKWYFRDNGIRNALINNFSSLKDRNDMGQLWEQYIISERMKRNDYLGSQPQYFFWRTYDGQEIDLLELDSKRRLHAFECKWGTRKAKKPVAFDRAYPEADFTIIDQTNYLEWIAK